MTRQYNLQGNTQGFSIIELMVVLSISGILASLAVPSMSNFLVGGALNSAQEDVSLALKKAKTIAVSRGTNVTVNITADSSTLALSSTDGSYNQNIDLPNTVAANATSAFQFNALGLVDTTGTITLNSTVDASAAKSINIATLFGQITVN